MHLDGLISLSINPATAKSASQVEFLPLLFKQEAFMSSHFNKTSEMILAASFPHYRTVSENHLTEFSNVYYIW